MVMWGTDSAETNGPAAEQCHGGSGGDPWERRDLDGDGTPGDTHDVDMAWCDSDKGLCVPAGDPLVMQAKLESARGRTLHPGDTFSIPFTDVLCDIGHQGLLHDREFGLIYNRLRNLDPVHGRFPQRDPIGYADGMSLYEYCRSMAPHCGDCMGTSTLRLAMTLNPKAALDAILAIGSEAASIATGYSVAYIDSWVAAHSSPVVQSALQNIDKAPQLYDTVRQLAEDLARQFARDDPAEKAKRASEQASEKCKQQQEPPENPECGVLRALRRTLQTQIAFATTQTRLANGYIDALNEGIVNAISRIEYFSDQIRQAKNLIENYERHNRGDSPRVDVLRKRIEDDARARDQYKTRHDNLVKDLREYEAKRDADRQQLGDLQKRLEETNRQGRALGCKGF
jgi:RHS repeat-associated protein